MRGECERAAGAAFADHQRGDGDARRRRSRRTCRRSRGRRRPPRRLSSLAAPGVSTSVRTGRPSRSASRMRRAAVRKPAGVLARAGLGGVGDRAAVAAAEPAQHPRVVAAARSPLERHAGVEVVVEVGLRARALGRAGAPHRGPARRAAGRGARARPAGRPATAYVRGAVGEQLEREHQRRRQLRARSTSWSTWPWAQLALGGERVRAGAPRTRWPAKATVAPGSARMTSAAAASVAQAPPVDGSRSTLTCGDARRARPCGGGGDALHLGQGAHALLHPAAAGGDERDHRPAQRGGAARRRRRSSGRRRSPSEPPRKPNSNAISTTSTSADAGVAADHGLRLAGAGARARELRVVARPGRAGRSDSRSASNSAKVVGDGRDRGARAAVGDRRRGRRAGRSCRQPRLQDLAHARCGAGPRGSARRAGACAG